MMKKFWFGRFFVGFQASKELYWTDRKLGGRLYHLFNIGVYDMSHLDNTENVKPLTIGAFTMTLLWFGIKIGWGKKKY